MKINPSKNSVEELFGFLKKSSTLKEAWINSITCQNDHSLVPICSALAAQDDVIRLLTEWRNVFVDVYSSQFVATQESTRKWLEEILLPSPSKILFLIVAKDGSYSGHIGLNLTDDVNGIIEVDNVLKSPACAEKGVMSVALNKMISWCNLVLPVDKVQLRVMSDNEKAIEFFKANHFKAVGKIGLVKKVDRENVIYTESKQGSDRFMDIMEFNEGYQPRGEMILTAGPSISQMEAFFAYDAALNGWNANWSYYLNQFQREFAAYVGAKFAIATSSCTGALQIALMSLDIGEGDEVLVPDETWVASATAIRDVGATPVFCDVDLATYNINVSDCYEKITERTRAIIPVHMYGNPANMGEVLEFAKKFNLKVVEDAAPSIGAKFGGKCVGTFGDFGCFSFQGAKMLVTGEGGMLVTDNEDLFRIASKIADQGRNPNKTFWIDQRGVKFKMSNSQAAIGLAQIRRSDLQIYMKQRLNGWYKEFLAGIECIEFQGEYSNSENINWMTSIRLLENAPISRDELMVALRKDNIDSRPLFPAISNYPIWSKEASVNQNAETLARSAMNLPSGVGLSKSKVEHICRCIRKNLVVSS